MHLHFFFCHNLNCRTQKRICQHFLSEENEYECIAHNTIMKRKCEGKGGIGKDVVTAADKEKD